MSFLRISIRFLNKCCNHFLRSFRAMPPSADVFVISTSKSFLRRSRTYRKKITSRLFFSVFWWFADNWVLWSINFRYFVKGKQRTSKRICQCISFKNIHVIKNENAYVSYYISFSLFLPVLSFFSATKTNIYKSVLFLKLLLKFQINKTNACSTKILTTTVILLMLK